MRNNTRFRTLNIVETNEGGLIFVCGSDLHYPDWKRYNETQIRRDNSVFKVVFDGYGTMSNELKEFWLDFWLKGKANATISTYRLD